MQKNCHDPIHAIFSDESPRYRFPAEPDPGDTVRLSLRTPRGRAARVVLSLGKDETALQMSRREMPKGAHGSEYFDYYDASIDCPKAALPYRFLIELDGETYLCNRTGVSLLPLGASAVTDGDFCILPSFHVPDWARGAVMYQIFPDRFCSGDEKNDVTSREYYYTGGHVERASDWNALPTDTDYRRFYGGDLRGILDKLDYIRSLGVEVIYLNPIFVSPSSHKYDAEDYDHVDPHFGVITDDLPYEMEPWEKSNASALRYIRRVTSRENLDASDALLAHLCAEIHKRGMRIILDGVFNHCGSFHKWMDREGIYHSREGAYHTEDSPYRSFFRFSDTGEDGHAAYEGWWGHDTLPKLNYEGSEALVGEILRIAEKWVSPPYSADGWRLDVAADLGHSAEYNHAFWKSFRKRVKEANPDAIILAEHYGSPRAWLSGDEWDTVMNYDAFMEPVSFFLTGMEKHSDGMREDLYQNGEAFFGLMLEKMAHLPMQSLLTAMNELSNHDHSRFLTRTSRTVGRITTIGSEAASRGINKAVFREAVTIQMTWPGAPTIYYADEAGQVGFTDPDSRRTYPWGHEDLGLIDLHRALTAVRRLCPVLRDGSLKPLFASYGQIAYGRFDEEKGDAAVIAVNNTAEDRTLPLPTWELGLPTTAVLGEIFRSDRQGIILQEGFLPSLSHDVRRTNSITHTAEGGILTLKLPPESSVILVTKIGQYERRYKTK